MADRMDAAGRVLLGGVSLSARGTYRERKTMADSMETRQRVPLGKRDLTGRGR